MHRRESILAAVATTLTGLTTTGANVTRSRAWPVAALPALTLAQGEDSVLDDDELATIQRVLALEVTVHAQAGQALETDLNAIAAEVYAALVADRSQGLAYVFDTALVSDGAAVIVGEQDQTQGQLVMLFNLRYQHSATSTES